MANLKLSHIYKVYENGHKAVNDFNIDIDDKEFIVFVGPSGCGKSTTLRMIAGLEEITAGDLFIGDTLVNDMEPKDRDIAMVFQNYALYPHMTVYDNMAFGLKNQHMPNDQIRERVLEAAKILDIEDYLERKPKAMSGGQRQRVALGRAIVRNPKVFLLDEPLSNLDAKLRAQMRTEITKLHKKLQTTFIYVTHDQVEAMTMGTRIVVMKLGYVQQIDTPLNLYNKPGNKFVAGFIGTPQMNFFDVTLLRNGDKVKVSFVKTNEKVRNTDDVADEEIKPVETTVEPNSEELESFELDYEVLSKVHDDYLHGDKVVTFGIRPDHLKIVDHETDLHAKVNVIEQLGNESIVYAQLNGSEASITGAGQIIIKIPAGTTYEAGTLVNVEVDSSKVHFFDKETEVTLINDVPDYAKFDAEVKDGKMNFLGSKVALPAFFAEKFGDLAKVSIQVPPSACIDEGKDFKLKVHKVEEFEGKKLVSLVLGDRYLFLLTNKDVKEGEDFSFSLENQKLTVLNGEEVILNPIGSTESLIGTFVKRTEPEHLFKINKTWMNEEEIAEEAKLTGAEVETLKSSAVKEKDGKRVHFYYNIKDDLNQEDGKGVSFRTPMPKVVKITTIEGPSCYTKEYKYVLDRNDLVLSKEANGLHGKVEKIIDYGNVVYALLKVGVQDLLVKVDRKFAEKEIYVSFEADKAEVFQIEIDMRIC